MPAEEERFYYGRKDSNGYWWVEDRNWPEANEGFARCGLEGDAAIIVELLNKYTAEGGWVK